MNVIAARGILPVAYQLDRRRPRLTYMGHYGRLFPWRSAGNK